MKHKKLARLLSFGLLILGFSFTSSAQSIKVPVEFSVRYEYLGEKWILSQEFNPSGQERYHVTAQVDVDRLLDPNYIFPTVQLSYEQPKSKIGGPANISSYLKKKKNPKVVVRVPEKIADANFVETIELALSELGWNVVDHNMAAGVKSVAEIRKHTGADIILDISWLKFSDPDMYSMLDKSAVKIPPFKGRAGVKDSYYKSKNKKKYKKWLETKDSKYDVLFWGYRHWDVNFSNYSSEIINQLGNYERFNISKNVISATFKLIDCSTGSILGFIQTGEAAECKIPGGTYLDSYGWGESYEKRLKFQNTSDFYNEQRYVITDPLLLTFLSYMDITLSNGEIPFAAQLNEMEDVKLSDQAINESYSSTSTTNGSSSGRSRDYYNSYFNSRYYSGSSSSRTDTHGSATTTFKDADYIHYSDFFGYYKPLTEKFVQEITRLLGE